MKINNSTLQTQSPKRNIAFGIITPEHLFIDIKGFGRNTKWAKTMVDVVNISSKKIQKGESDFDKIINFVSQRYEKYYRKLHTMTDFGVFRKCPISTPIFGYKYETYLKQAEELIKKDSKKDVMIIWPKLFFEISEEAKELRHNEYVKTKCDIHTMSTSINGKEIPLTETYRVFEFPKGIRIEPNAENKEEALIWHHTKPEYIPELLDNIKILYSNIFNVETDDLCELTEKTGEIHWLLSQTAPFRRGSAGIADLITKSIFEAKKIQVSPWKKGIAPDLEALTQPLDSFKKNYINLFEKPPEHMK